MSITPGTGNAPHHTPLMTDEQQEAALTLLAEWLEYDWMDPDSDPAPKAETEALMSGFVASWRRA